MVNGDWPKRGPGMPSGLAGSSPASATAGFAVRRATSSSGVVGRGASTRGRRRARRSGGLAVLRLVHAGSVRLRTAQVHGSMPPVTDELRPGARPTTTRGAGRLLRGDLRVHAGAATIVGTSATATVDTNAWQLLAALVVTSLVFWLMHVYVRVIGVEMPRHVPVRAAIREASLKELPILVAVVPPALVVAARRSSSTSRGTGSGAAALWVALAGQVFWTWLALRQAHARRGVAVLSLGVSLAARAGARRPQGRPQPLSRAQEVRRGGSDVAEAVDLGRGAWRAARGR